MLAAEDEQFRRRILGTIETVKRWDRDSTLLRRVRDSIPMDDLMSSSKFDRPDDVMLDPSVRFIQRLSRYFKHKMTWINQPKCQTCQSNEHMTLKKTRGPETDEEKFGQANRVEVYTCSKCPDGNETTFPRYNNVAKLFETHSGRCGEYANLFGLYCRALGYETRYIHDVTDHVWIEVYIPRNLGNTSGETTTTTGSYWMMVDACEGVIDETSMYEAGWNKKLSYIIAVSTTHVIDVTSKYTRQFLDADFQARRRAITTSEESGESIIKQLNSTLLNNISTAKEKEQIERRLRMEQEYLQQYERYQTKWIHRYGRGRISGSLVWKQQRQEDGGGINNNNQQETKSSSSPSHLYVEPYYYHPKGTSSTSTNITIVVRPYPYIRHEAIQVNGVSCAIGVLHTLSVVVMDETYIGCILQSKCCTSLQQLLDFIQTIPCQRIVAIVGSLPNKGNEDEDNTPYIMKQLSKQLGGFDGTLAFEDKNGSGILYIGQVVGGGSGKKSADWTYCCSFQDHPNGFVLERVGGAGDDSSLATTTNLKLNLKTISGYKPTSVIGRLPEHVMPMETQKLASHSQKRIAFHQFVGDNCKNVWISGYCTKPGMPIYLLGSNAYPFVQSSSSSSGTTKDDGNAKHADWTTFLRLPSPLVSEDDHGLEDDDANTKKTASSLPSFEVPVDTTFFSQRLGSELWKGTTKIPTSVALHNTRLVALYFSAHWCGPCRSFTPMLAEMYDVLKEAYPTHGLEIVFVTSDRDANSFTQYYSTMPWLAIPFENLNPFMKQTLSTTYGVRGIPSLVVLDSISGQIVISQNETRQHVMEACRKGDDGIDEMFQRKWLSQIPLDSKQLMDMLQRSCEEDNKKSNGDGNSTNNDSELQYLLRPTNENSSSLEERQKLLVQQLIEEGVDEEEAEESARIIIMDMEDDDDHNDTEEAEPSLLDGYFQRRTLTNANELTLRDEAFPEAFVEQVKKDSPSLITTALNASLKYLENCRKEPYNPKYRQFLLGNKFASKTITNALGVIPLLESIGFTCSPYEDDFTIMIPIYANLDTMYQSITQLLEDLS